jgi:DNA-binding LacI/PurR family transcriptional regulator
VEGLTLGELLTPELTTLSIDSKEMGVVAVKLVEELLGGQLEPGREGQHALSNTSSLSRLSS